MRLTFYGGAKSVTGANYLFDSGKNKILVDCGLSQGSHFAERQNFEPFSYKPEEIEAVFITHAHIDHIGRLPQFYKAGFRGKIYSSPPTKDFAELLLLDSEHILREEAEKHKKPFLYDVSDVLKTMSLWQKLPYHEKVQIGDFSVELYNAGHILGSSSVVISGPSEGAGQIVKVVASGDLGNIPTPMIQGTEYIENADYALVESVYGNRIHEDSSKRKDLLEDFIEETVKNKGVLLIPSFAMERTQELLFELNELVENNRIPRAPVFVDSPLAIKLTAIYQKYAGDGTYFNSESISLMKAGESIFNFPGLHTTLTTEQSKEINNVPPPKIIVAGSGMSQGGRILHHECRYLSDPKNAILFVGYQAAGSLGRAILNGAKSVRIFGEEVSVRCRVKAIGGYSAHADQVQLLKWVDAMRLHVKKVFVVQGEEEEAGPLAQKIKDDLAVEAEVPSPNESVVL